MDDFLKFLDDNKDTLGLLFGSGLLLAILGGLYRFVRAIIVHYRNRKTHFETFPFAVIPPQSDVACTVLGGDEHDPLADRNIPYQTRISGRNIRRELENLLETHRWVLILGRTGLGKTREAVHLAQSLNDEGWTVLYLTREDWLEPPPHLPKEIGSDRKLLFLLDDLNRKIYASRIEQSPRAKDGLIYPLTEPLQDRVQRTLEAYEMLCGKGEVCVIATVRNETFTEYEGEPSEWDKLQVDRYKAFWDRFAKFELLEPENRIIAHVLNVAATNSGIDFIKDELPIIAAHNDGTFANAIENLRSARNNRESLSIENYRDTLKGTWERRYQEAVRRHHNSIYIYQAVALLREARIDLFPSTVIPIARLLISNNLLRQVIFSWAVHRAFNYLLRNENILTPRDGQIEASKFNPDISKYQNKLTWLFIIGAFFKRALLKQSVPYYFSKLSQEKGHIRDTPTVLLVLLLVILYYPEMVWFEILNLIRWKAKAQSFLKKSYLRSTRTNPMLLNALAQNYESLGRYDEAIVIYQEAIDLDPQFASFHYKLGNIYRAQQRYTEAEIAYESAIKLAPQHSRIYYEMGIMYFQQRLYYKAEAAYSKAIELNPQYANPYHKLGNVSLVQGRYVEAETAYRKAISLDSLIEYPSIGFKDFEQKQITGEEAVYRTAITLEPTFAPAYNGLGNIYFRRRNYIEAEAAYRKAIKLDPKYATPHNGLGTMYRALSSYADAEKEYRRAIELDAQDVFSRVNLAAILRKMGRTIEFHEQVDLARRYLGNESEYTLAGFESVFGNVNKALSLLEAAILNDEGLRDTARSDPDFDFIRDDPRFQALVGM